MHRRPILTYRSGSLPSQFIQPSPYHANIDFSDPVFSDHCSIGNNPNAILHVSCPALRCGLSHEGPLKSPLRILHEGLDITAAEDEAKYERRISSRSRRPRVAGEKIVGGEPCAPTQWPFVVGMYRDGSFHCGGIIQNELWIISAAHCVADYTDHYYEIRAGMLRKYSYSPMSQTVKVVRIVVHENYDRLGKKFIREVSDKYIF